MFFSRKKENRIKAEPVSLNDENDDANIDNELYRRGDVISFPVGDGQALVYSQQDRKANILPTFVVSLLTYCHSFKTLEAHAEACVESLRLDQQQIDYVHDSLLDLAQSGLLTPLRSARDLPQEPRDNAGPLKIATVCFVTHDRPDSLRRGILSYLE